MLSASFLEMETLVEECCNFCRNNFNQILETKQSFSPVNDHLMERLVCKFSLMDLENVADKRPSVQSRFYCQLIADLCKEAADPKRGIFKTAASLYCCSNCGNLVSYPEDSKVPCLQNRVSVNLTGEIRYRHSRDESWSLSSHVISLKTEFKSWRRVFWRLWSQVHYLHCCHCDTTFAVANMRMCRYHADTPVFATTSRNKSGTLPVGTYKCCQKNAYRYAPIPLHDGCKTREHVIVCNKNEENLKILEIFKKYEDFILIQNSLKKSPVDCVLTPEDLSSRFGSSFTRRSHLIPLNLGFKTCAVNLAKESRPKTANSQASSTSESVDSGEKFSRVSIYNTISFSEEDEDDVSVDYVDSPCKSAKKKPVKKFQKNGSTKERFNKPPQPLERETDLRWNPVLATRVNQDNQRYAEEEFFHSLSKCKSELQWDVSSQPTGGVFAKISQNLREKSQREARAAKLATTTRSAITAAVAANRFKAKINQKLIK